MGWRPFPYCPLSGTQIRFITVHRSNGATGKVRCTLHQAPLEEVDFNALSYVWGDPNVTETIILSGKPFSVTTNLAACLRQLAIRSAETNFWVDAICINQNDINERNIEVQRMKNIYPAARFIIAWLGSSTKLSRIGARRLQKIDFSDTARLLELGKGQQIKQKRCIVKRVLEGDGEKGLHDLLLRPYWRRTWVIQEFVLGQRGIAGSTVLLLCGEDEVPFYNLWTLTRLLFELYTLDLRTVDGQAEDTTEPSNSGWRRRLAQFFSDAEVGSFRVMDTVQKPTRPLLDLLLMFRPSQCSDNRDKIYALLGISSDAEGISPDYNKSTATVYSDAVYWIIKKHGSLDVLSMACNHSERDLSLASWIPDWRCGAPDAQGFANNVKGTNLYRASKGLSVFSHPWSLNSTAGRLYLSGACLDAITSLSNVTPSNCTRVEDFDSPIMGWLLMVHQLHGKGAFETTLKLGLDGGCYPLNDEPLAKACRRTLVTDYDRFGTSSARSPFMMLFPWDRSQRRSDGSLYSHEFTDGYVNLLRRRRLAITSKGWIGMVQNEAEVGDHVAVLIGARVPFILRKAQVGMARTRDNEYTLIGDAYIHGLMHGRGLDLAEMGEIVLH